MQTEFEAAFLAINKDEVRNRLKEEGAVLVYPEYLMKRVTFNLPHVQKGAWLRVRQEAEKVTMSLKRIEGSKITDQKEIQLEINSFKEGVKFLLELGAKDKSYQETKRELWYLGEVEVTIDTWPGLNPFIEIEAQDEKTVKQVSEKLGFNYSEAVFGPADLVYEKELGIPSSEINENTPEITFANPPKKYVKK